MKHTFYGLLVTAILLTSGCGNSKKQSGEIASEEQNADTVRVKVLTSLGGSTMTRLLHASGLEFQMDALNDIRQVPHYAELSNPGATAANLGVYMSDLGYLTDFEKREEAKRYFDGCVVLAADIGMGKQFSRAVELRFSEIISGNEALKTSLDKLFRNATNNPAGDDFKKLHAAALAGYYIEELYHMVMVDKMQAPAQANARIQALQVLISQRTAMDHLIDYFDNLALKPEGILVYQEFLRLQSKYHSLDAARLGGETDPAVIMADSNFKEIVASIVAIRNSITGA